jgi:hypothetical protein
MWLHQIFFLDHLLVEANKEVIKKIVTTMDLMGRKHWGHNN